MLSKHQTYDITAIENMLASGTIKFTEMVPDLADVELIDLFSGGSCNIIGPDGNHTENTKRLLLNLWANQFINVADPQLGTNTPWKWEVHGIAEVEARKHARCRLYELSSRTFGALTCFEISIDVAQMARGKLDKKHVLVVFDENVNAAGIPEFKPYSVDLENPAKIPTAVLLAHFKEALAAGNKMRKYFIKEVATNSLLYVTQTEAETSALIGQLGGQRVTTFKLTKRKLHAGELAAAITATFTTRQPVIVQFEEFDDTPSYEPIPLGFDGEVTPEWVEANKAIVLMVLAEYLQEGNNMRKALSLALKQTGLTNLHLIYNGDWDQAIQEVANIFNIVTEDIRAASTSSRTYQLNGDPQQMATAVELSRLSWTAHRKKLPVLARFDEAKQQWLCQSLSDPNDTWYQSGATMMDAYCQATAFSNGWFLFNPNEEYYVEAARFTQPVGDDTTYAILNPSWENQHPQPEGGYAHIVYSGQVILRKPQNPDDVWVLDAKQFEELYDTNGRPVSNGKPKVVQTTTTWRYGHSSIEEHLVLVRQLGNQTSNRLVRRFVFNPGTAVTIGLVHISQDETGKNQYALVLTYQNRRPMHEFNDGWMLEFPAGMLEDGEDSDECAIREIYEEVHYNVKPQNLHSLGTFALEPGTSSGVAHLKVAFVSDEDRLPGEIGGVEDENENIQRFYLPLEEAIRMVNSSIDVIDLRLAYLILKIKDMLEL